MEIKKTCRTITDKDEAKAAKEATYDAMEIALKSARKSDNPAMIIVDSGADLIIAGISLGPEKLNKVIVALEETKKHMKEKEDMT